MDLSLIKKSMQSQDYLSLLKQDKPFEDADFPPIKASLWNKDKTKLTDKQLQKWDTFTWEKPASIFKGKPVVVFSEIDPNDIIQGSLGNCYFLSALSAIAEFPERIKKIFLVDKTNTNGCYAVKLCINGEFKTVLVDDKFPYYAAKEKPAFSKSKGNELWVLILEKAWAKLNGGYENTITGFPNEAFRVLLGAPTIFYNHEMMTPEDIWATIRDSDQKNYVICASAGRTHVTREEFDSIGLISDHAYSVIWANEVEIPGKGTEKLLKLRNPWGFQEWRGDWSDSSPLWTDELKKKVGFDGVADDGVFYIALKDYLNYYRSTTACKYNDGFVYRSIRVDRKPDKNWCIYSVQIPNKTRAFVTISQYRIRMIPNDTYTTSFVKIILAKRNITDPKCPLEFIEGKCGRDEDVTLECENEIEAGEYVVFLEMEWENNYIDGYVCGVYAGADKLQIELDKSGLTNETFLSAALSSCARKRGKRKDYSDKGEADIYKVLSITDSNAEYGLLYYENNSKDFATLIETCIFNKLENYVLIPPYASNKVDVTVGPGESAIAVLKRTERSSAYACSYFTNIVNNDEKLTKDAEANGKKTQIKYQDKLLNIYFNVLPFGSGFVWLFKNETKDIYFEGIFKYDVKNMALTAEDQLDATSWKIALKPGAQVMKKLMVKDLSQGWGYKFAYTYKCVELMESEDSIMQKVKAKGKIKQITQGDVTTLVSYWVLFFNDIYYWYIENLEKDKKFQGKFEFELENLVVDGDEKSNGWTVKLGPGEKVLKKLRKVDPNVEPKSRLKFGYALGPVTK